MDGTALAVWVGAAMLPQAHDKKKARHEAGL